MTYSMAIRKGEAGIVNRSAYLDSLANDIHQLNSDIRFYKAEYADREVVTRAFLQQKHFKSALIMYVDKLLWKRRIRQARRLKKSLVKLNRKAASWLQVM